MELFAGKTDLKYQLISADSHINEPPDLWTSRLSKRFQDRAPRMEHFDDGDGWILEGVSGPVNFGFNASAGMGPQMMKGWINWSDVRPGGYDPKERLKEQDLDGVDAEVLYPTPRISGSIFANPDREFHLELVRAYNDWLAEYCHQDPRRLLGLALLPNCGIDDALAEFERVMALDGIRGVLIGQWPHGGLDIDDADDGLWEVASATGTPVSIHVRMVGEMPGTYTEKIPAAATLRFGDAPTRMLQLLYSGALDRFPDLHVVFAEVDCGWVPYFKEQVNDRFIRQGRAAGMSLARRPSEYIEDHFSFSYITDHFGVNARASIGVDRMLWSSDYPHVGGDWPNSWLTIAADFDGVPAEERHAILAGNAEKLYLRDADRRVRG